MYGSGPVGRELVGSEAVQRSRSEAGIDLSKEFSLSSRLLHLVVGQLHVKSHGGEGSLERGSDEVQRRCMSGSRCAFGSIRLSSLLFAAHSAT